MNLWNTTTTILPMTKPAMSVVVEIHLADSFAVKGNKCMPSINCRFVSIIYGNLFISMLQPCIIINSSQSQISLTTEAWFLISGSRVLQAMALYILLLNMYCIYQI